MCGAGERPGAKVSPLPDATTSPETFYPSGFYEPGPHYHLFSALALSTRIGLSQLEGFRRHLLEVLQKSNKPKVTLSISYSSLLCMSVMLDRCVMKSQQQMERKCQHTKASLTSVDFSG